MLKGLKKGRGAMKFCCLAMESLYDNKDKRGLSLQIKRSDNELIFWLVVRSVELHDEDKMEGTNVACNIMITTRTRMIYCPWCGKYLKRWGSKKRFKEVWEKGQAGSIYDPIEFEKVMG